MTKIVAGVIGRNDRLREDRAAAATRPHERDAAGEGAGGAGQRFELARERGDGAAGIGDDAAQRFEAARESQGERLRAGGSVWDAAWC